MAKKGHLTPAALAARKLELANQKDDGSMDVDIHKVVDSSSLEPHDATGNPGIVEIPVSPFDDAPVATGLDALSVDELLDLAEAVFPGKSDTEEDETTDPDRPTEVIDHTAEEEAYDLADAGDTEPQIRPAVDEPTDEQLEEHMVSVMGSPSPGGEEPETVETFGPNIELMTEEELEALTAPTPPPAPVVVAPVVTALVPKVTWLKHQLPSVNAHDYWAFRKRNGTTHVKFITDVAATALPGKATKNDIVLFLLDRYDTDGIAALHNGETDHQLLQYLGQLTERGWQGLINKVIVRLTVKA